MAKPSILLVGCGNMGRALLSGWEKKNVFSTIVIVDPNPPQDLQNKYKFHGDILEVKQDFDVIVLAVKPQIFTQILPELKVFALPGAFFLSIAAGKTIESIAYHAGESAAIIRAMPNTPAMIGEGMTVCVANQNVTPEQTQTAQDLLSAVGDVLWIADENHMHAVTALSGSGPAYVFAMIDAMQKSGVALGLDASFADQLARKTVQGSSALALQSPHTALSVLRENVTSPGGTTEAALNVLLNEDILDRLFAQAIQAAAKRSEELA